MNYIKSSYDFFTDNFKSLLNVKKEDEIKEETDSIELPAEVLTHIFSLLDLKSLTQVMLVSKYWREIGKYTFEQELQSSIKVAKFIEVLAEEGLFKQSLFFYKKYLKDKDYDSLMIKNLIDVAISQKNLNLLKEVSQETCSYDFIKALFRATNRKEESLFSIFCRYIEKKPFIDLECFEFFFHAYLDLLKDRSPIELLSLEQLEIKKEFFKKYLIIKNPERWRNRAFKNKLSSLYFELKILKSNQNDCINCNFEPKLFRHYKNFIAYLDKSLFDHLKKVNKEDIRRQNTIRIGL